MSKLTREQRIEIYVKRKDRESKSSLSEQYNINKSRIEYMVRLVDYHGLDILRKDKGACGVLEKNNLFNCIFRIKVLLPLLKVTSCDFFITQVSKFIFHVII